MKVNVVIRKFQSSKYNAYVVMFQAKLRKYRNEAEDYKSQVEQLSCQTKRDEETIRRMQAKVEEQHLQLQTQKVS